MRYGALSCPGASHAASTSCEVLGWNSKTNHDRACRRVGSVRSSYSLSNMPAACEDSAITVSLLMPKYSSREEGGCGLASGREFELGRRFLRDPTKRIT